MTRIHKEGRRILTIILALLLALNLILIKNYDTKNTIYQVSVFFSITIYLWIAYFFRDPKRVISKDKNTILAPADGKILHVEEVYEDEYFKDKRLKISIFMSPMNVHVNRNPISGIIKFFKYHAGKYLVAFNPKSSKKNERTTVVIENEDGFEILFRQIAGFVARRIKFYGKQGDYVEQGEQAGFIKFGSRADVFLPVGTKIMIQKGDKVKGGLSILALLDE